ncbi:hypothetical protein G6F56_003983 [Rhizopus delemar]|nr:hypothetical protein G6F56_003983 [Rhizopus delemar]
MEAYVTLVATEAYASGALVIAHRLREMETTRDLVCLVTPNISQHVQTLLSKYFIVQPVDTLSSKDTDNLLLLGRPELDITFTKIHAWRLIQYKKIVFLDADTLPLLNIDSLFLRPSFSAAPDAGWPDCFNSGVFVAEPSEAVFEDLLELAGQKGSFDGGDQGLLNTYFNSWPESSSNRLPFVFNTTPTAQYGYAPAQVEYGHNIHIAHFIGPNKPWKHQRLSDGNVMPLGSSWKVVQQWWNTWDKHYGKTSPYHLLSADLAFDGGFKTIPIVHFNDVIRNAWENEQCDLTKKQINPMPPLSITVITPDWLQPVKEELPIQDNPKPQYRHHHESVWPTIEWNPAYEDPPKTGQPGAEIPDLSSYQNVWDQSLDDQVWVAPVFQPEPEIMMKPEYVHHIQETVQEQTEATFPWESNPSQPIICKDESSLDKQPINEEPQENNLDLFALDQPLSPSAQTRIEDIMADLQEEEDTTDRDLIPIFFKSSSRLQQYSPKNSQNTSRRSSAVSSRRNSLSERQDDLDYFDIPYSLNSSLASKTPELWNPLDALTKLKSQSESMVLKQSLVEALGEPKEYKWMPESVFDSGGSSPRTPVLRAMATNLTQNDLFHQQESLRMAQPKMAVASLFEAELDLSRGSLFQKRHEEVSREEKTDSFFSQDIVREAQRRLNALVMMEDQEEAEDVLPLSQNRVDSTLEYIKEIHLPTQVTLDEEWETVQSNKRLEKRHEEFVVIDERVERIEESYATESDQKYQSSVEVSEESKKRMIEVLAESSAMAAEKLFEKQIDQLSSDHVEFIKTQRELTQETLKEMIRDKGKQKEGIDKLKMIKRQISKHPINKHHYKKHVSQEVGRYSVETFEVDSDLQELIENIEKLQQVIEGDASKVQKSMAETLEIEEETLEIEEETTSVEVPEIEEVLVEMIEIEDDTFESERTESQVSLEIVEIDSVTDHEYTEIESLQTESLSREISLEIEETLNPEINLEFMEIQENTLNMIANREVTPDIIKQPSHEILDESYDEIGDEASSQEEELGGSTDTIKNKSYFGAIIHETTDEEDEILETEPLDRETSLDIIEEHDYEIQSESMSRQNSYDIISTHSERHESNGETTEGEDDLVQVEALSRESSLDIIEMDDVDASETDIKDFDLDIMGIEDVVLKAEKVSYELDSEESMTSEPETHTSSLFARFLANTIGPAISRPTMGFPRPSLSASLLSSSRIASASTVTTPAVGESSGSIESEENFASRVRSLKGTTPRASSMDSTDTTKASSKTSTRSQSMNNPSKS